MTREQSHKIETQRNLSRIENCRSWKSVWSILRNVLQQGPQPCSHALPFGYCFLCTHPQVDEIIENTKKAQLAELCSLTVLSRQ